MNASVIQRSFDHATPNGMALAAKSFAWAVLCWAMFLFAAPRSSLYGADGELSLQVVDAQASPLPCRVHLSDDQGRPVRPPEQPFWHDHFVIDGRLLFSLPTGRYQYQIERGPEFERVTGTLKIEAAKRTEVRATLHRLASLRESGWFSGDLHVHRPLSEVEALMRAEDLDFAPVITWWNDSNAWLDQPPPQSTVRRFDGHRWYTVMAGEDEREGGALLYYGLNKPLDLTAQSREFPSPMKFVAEARKRDRSVWIDIEKPFWWDVPTWLASGQMNSIGLANNHMCRSQMLPNEAWGKPRDQVRLPSPLGNGYWTQEIYYHMLNAGLRLPPSAGSASGVLPNPVGYNRVYVQLNEPFTPDAWFAGLKQGRCFVTNGPLLLVQANGLEAGGTLKLDKGKSLRVSLNLRLITQDRVEAIEVIHNGQVIERLACQDRSDQTIETQVTVDGPGWLLIRAVADVKETFRFASTAPWYLEDEEGQGWISGESSQFFLDWVQERIQRLRNTIQDESQLAEVLKPHERALEFWQRRVDLAVAQTDLHSESRKSPGPHRTLRVLSFNILQGGGDAANVGFDNRDFDGSRLDEIADVIRLSKADIVGVQEDAGSSELLEQLGPRWRREGSVYSRFPLELLEKQGGTTVVRVRLAEDCTVVVANVHWRPNDYGPFMAQELIRAQGAPQDLAAFEQEVLEHSDKSAGGRGYQETLALVKPLLAAKEAVIITGDFNEPSHLDWTGRAAAEGLDRWVDNPTGIPLRFPIRWRGSQLLEEHGFQDAYRTHFKDEVKKPGITWTPPYPDGRPGRRLYAEQVLDRIDRIYFAGTRLSVAEAAVVGESPQTSDLSFERRWPSDHRAVLSVFRL